MDQIPILKKNENFNLSKEFNLLYMIYKQDQSDLFLLVFAYHLYVDHLMLSMEQTDVVVEDFQFEQHMHVVIDYLIDYAYKRRFDRNRR